MEVTCMFNYIGIYYVPAKITQELPKFHNKPTTNSNVTEFVNAEIYALKKKIIFCVEC